jgi:PBP1b-binding outer membrane lipoprotein LpoB
MKKLLALAPLLAVFAGCAYYNTPPAVAVTPAPANTVVVPAQPAPSTTVVVPNR